MPFPFEVSFETVETDIDAYVDKIFSNLRSELLTLPKGPGFVEYPVFQKGYEELKKATGGFRELSPERLIQIVYDVPICLIVLRTILGLTPPEWAYVASQETAINITQGAARTIDRKIRMRPEEGL